MKRWKRIFVPAHWQNVQMKKYQIPCVIGRDKNSRLVGRVMSMAGYYGKCPCHRVVNHAGRLVPGWREQNFLLESEGVTMKDESHVDLRLCRWEC